MQLYLRPLFHWSDPPPRRLKVVIGSMTFCSAYFKKFCVYDKMVLPDYFINLQHGTCIFHGDFDISRGTYISVGCDLFLGFISVYSTIMDLPVDKWVKDLPILQKDYKMHIVCNQHEVGV